MCYLMSLKSFKKTIMGRTDFSYKLRKLIIRYKRICSNLNVMRKSVCIVFLNPIMVDNYVTLFNCEPVGRPSDSLMVPT